MKKRIGYICLFVSFLLICCTFLSRRVEENMMTLAVTRTVKSFGRDIILPGSVLFEDSGIPALYVAEEGLGWNIGLRAKEVSNGSYEIMADGRLKLQFGADHLIYTASREPVVGQRVNRLDGDKRETAPDQYLVIYCNGVPAKHELPKNISLVKRNDNVMLLAAAESALPFMEHEVKGKFDSIRGLQWRIYSMTDLEQLVGCLPWISLLAVLAVIPPVLFLLGACLPAGGSDRNRGLGLHVAVGIGFLAGFIGLIRRIRLPFSLVPEEMIFRWKHYDAQLQTALDALQRLEEPGLAAMLAQTQRAALWILGLGAVLLIGLAAVTVFLWKKDRMRSVSGF